MRRVLVRTGAACVLLSCAGWLVAQRGYRDVLLPPESPWGALDPPDDQRIGFSHLKDGRAGNQTRAKEPGCRHDAERAALSEIARERTPVAERMKRDGEGERDAGQLVRELEGVLDRKEHDQSGQGYEDPGADRERRGPGPGLPVLHGVHLSLWPARAGDDRRRQAASGIRNGTGGLT
jgi:hypothetical protein